MTSGLKRASRSKLAWAGFLLIVRRCLIEPFPVSGDDRLR